LESTFMSAARVLSRVRILPFDAFDNMAKLGRVGCPVLVIHGENDQTIPFIHGISIYDSVTGPKSYLWLPEAGHNNVFDSSPSQYLAKIKEFAGNLPKQ
jgi:abhydrolase domain-containing protein 17